MSHLTGWFHNYRRSLAAAVVLVAGTSGAAAFHRPPKATLAGDWDVYIALSATPKFGFEGWR
ncbi:MAG: hypothetical protein ABIZ70_06620, partial [Gemmatimonadales bacterium]